MRVMVTGAHGMLSASLIPVLRAADHRVYLTDIVGDLPRCDVRDEKQIADRMVRYQPEVVLHLAAITSLEECEIDPDNAWHTNALGTKYVASACRWANIPMLYVSSAGVFDGEQDEPYTEFDTPNPINVYGRSKFAGEGFVDLSRGWIVRAGWMMSGGAGVDHKFVSLIVAQIKAGATVIRAVDDKFGSPTYGPDLSRGICNLIGSDRYGLYHMAGGDRASRYDVACEIVRLLGSKATVERALSLEFGHTYFARRPRSEAMRNMVLELEGWSLRPWKIALAEYLEDWK